MTLRICIYYSASTILLKNIHLQDCVKYPIFQQVAADLKVAAD